MALCAVIFLFFSVSLLFWVVGLVLDFLDHFPDDMVLGFLIALRLLAHQLFGETFEPIFDLVLITASYPGSDEGPFFADFLGSMHEKKVFFFAPLLLIDDGV